jgi:serine/threonine protein kinase
MDRRSIEEGGDETEDEDMFSRTITQSTGAALMSAAHKANTDTRPKLDLTNHLLQSRAQRESPSASTATTAASTSAQTGDTWFSTSSDQTPPSPSLLSSTLNEALLSRKRLRLISRMFGQMCAAVAACHDVGVAHRDIKPENFIVMDGRGESGEGKKEGARVVVKITDWGLGTRELECEDFDCGSKPYMAYGVSSHLSHVLRASTDPMTQTECRNNLQPTYDPRQADVWSLGLVLLNLLFHRNPWADPSLDDLDFADYVRDPIAFLKDRFEGIGTEVATFLTDRVFCDVLEMESDGKMRRRATAGEFGKWSSRLVTMMGEGRRRKASVSEHTIELTSTSSRAGGVILSGVNGSLSPLSMDDNFERMDEIVEEGLMKDAVTFSDSAPAPTTIQSPSTFIINNIESPTSNLRLSSLSIMKPTSTFNFDDLDSTLPSPSFPPSSLPLYATLAPAPSASPSLLSDMLRQSTPSPSGTPIDQAAPPRILRTTTDTQSRTISASPSAPLISPLPASTISISSTTPAPSSPPVLSNDSTEASAEEETATETLKAKRRKRGIRKGKGGAKSLEIDSSSALSLVPSSLEILPAIDTNHDRVLADLAAASQDLARELSNTKTTLKSSCFGTQSASAIALTSSYPANKIGQNAAGMEAFKQRAESKNSSFGNSAPAKMQNHRVDRTWASANTESNGSRTGAIGTASWGSEMESGPSSIGIDPGHWSSASSRRDRLDKQRIRPGLGLSPPSSSATITRVNGISNSNVISANNTTAATTFTTGFDALFSHGHSRSVEQDWRHTTSAAEKPVKSVPSAPTFKTKVIDMPSASPSTTLAPSPLYKAENDQYRPPHQRNGLSKLLQGITVFNRSNERKTKD